MHIHLPILTLAGIALCGNIAVGQSLRISCSVDETVETRAVTTSRTVAKIQANETKPKAWRINSINNPAKVNATASLGTPTAVTYNDLGDKVTLTWQAANGATAYNIYEAGATASDIQKLGSTSSTTFDITKATDSGEEGITLFGVTATAGAEESQIAASPVLTTGPIAPLPWKESFRNGKSDKFFWTERTSDEQWGVLTDAAGLPSMDGDNGLLAFLAISNGDYFTLHTGKIALGEKTALVFSRYYRTGQDVELTVTASFPDGTSRQVFQSVNDGTAEAYWKTELVDLTEYKTYRYCTLSFKFLSKDYFPDGGALVALDGIQMFDNKRVDIASSLILPEKVMKGQTINGSLEIINNTTYRSPSLNVVITANGQTITSGTINTKIPPLGKGVLPVAIPTSSLMQDEVMEVSATLTADNDEVPDNDTDIRSINMIQTWRNPVESLKAATAPGQGVSLSWEAPLPNSKQVDDGFEDYAPWATEFGEWVTVDIDKAYHGGVFPVSDYPGQFEEFAFKVMTPEEIGEENNSHNGRSYLGAPFGLYDDPDDGTTYADSDAWLISPELSGEAQTGSFYAASTPAWNAWWEKFDQTDEYFYIMYSKTGNTVSDFKDFCYAGSISNKNIVDDEHYVKIEFEIPEGAHYFAIRHFTPAETGCMLRLDDFSYIAGGSPVAYNIYADGELTGNSPSIGYNDTEAKARKYAVTAIYRDGSESLPAEVDADQASITLNTADTVVTPFDIYNLQGIIIRRAVTSIEDANLAPGIYVAKGQKITVK